MIKIHTAGAEISPHLNHAFFFLFKTWYFTAISTSTFFFFFAVKGHPTLEKAAVSRKIPSTEPFNHRSHRISVN